MAAIITNAHSLDYRDWHLPLRRDRITLREALADMQRVGAQQNEVPLMVQLVENPRYTLPGLTVFHGAVDLRQHDFIHLALGRGLLPMDEAFTIGFTMGSTNQVTTLEEDLFALVSKNLYPSFYQLGDDDLRVFRDAVRLGFISGCQPLDEVEFDHYLDLTLAETRQRIGLEVDLLLAYYAIEQRRFPESLASRRLLDV
ncbi:MAG TPA: hypothetical protein VIR60_00655 [Gammaproteobacteria bacterium]